VEHIFEIFKTDNGDSVNKILEFFAICVLGVLAGMLCVAFALLFPLHVFITRNEAEA